MFIGSRSITVLTCALLLLPLFCSSQETAERNEVHQLFLTDQADRQSSNIDWSKVSPRDAERRKRVHQLLAEGKLATAQDFHDAAFIFQHGDKPEDFLLAHVLAIAAVAKGDAASQWIAAATLDRYLQKIERAQIFGTQYFNQPPNPWTQEPYDRTLIPDALRAVFGVPSQSEQQNKLQHMNQSEAPKQK